MTIAELHSDEERRQHEFPVSSERIFLAHAGVCPIPRRVASAIQEYAGECMRGDQETLLPAFRMHETRALAARLLNATPEEVAFVGPTSLGLSFVAGGLKFRRNDNIIIYFDDYPSNVYPWMALAEQGVQVRLLNVRELGRIRPVDIMGQVDEQTRLVALASCHFISGWRLEVDAIGKFLRSRGILFCLDAIQTAGAFPISVEHVDFLAADAHKWMLGPCAAGILYVRKAVQERLRPPIYGWHNVRSPGFVAQEEMLLLPDARRYEAGSANLLGLAGLHAAMELLLEVGIDNIAAELLRKRRWLVPALEAKGYVVMHSGAGEANASGIISFWKEGTEMNGLVERLQQAGVTVSLRTDRSGRSYARISPHFYNTDAELHRLLEWL